MEPTVFETYRPANHVIDEALADVKLSCFWMEDIAEKAARYPELVGDAHTDYAVVGGGYAGLWTAIN